MVLAHITMGAESDEWVVHDAATLFPMMQTSRSYGCVHELFQLIPTVTILARKMSEETKRGSASDDLMTEYLMLRSAISSWQPDSDDEVHSLCGKLYQQALLVFLASFSEQGGESTEAGYPEEVQQAFDIFIPILDSVSPQASISTTLCWPLAIFGSCARTDEHRAVIANRLEILSDVYSAQSVRDTKVLLEKMWQRPTMTNPLCLEQIMREGNTAVLFL